MKKVLIAATLALALVVGFVPSPASADPARASQGSGFGINVNLGGSPLVERTPQVVATAPPDTGLLRREITLPIDADPLAINATLTAEAQANQQGGINPRLRPADNITDPVTQTDNNARGYAEVECLQILVMETELGGLSARQLEEECPTDTTDGGGGGGVLPGGTTMRQNAARSTGGLSVFDILREVEGVQEEVGALVEVVLIQAEAVARCVADRAVFETGFDLVEDPQILEDLLEDLLTDVDLQPLVETEAGTTGDLPGGGRFVDALRIRVLDTGDDALGDDALLDIVAAHAEARMPTPCGIERPRPPTGPGPVAPALAATGNDMGTWPLMAFGVLGAAVILRRTMLVRTSRRTF